LTTLVVDYCSQQPKKWRAVDQLSAVECDFELKEQEFEPDARLWW
jgi:hypothetical protein